MKYWRNDARLQSKFEGERPSSPRKSIRIAISREEWRDAQRWMHLSLGESEAEPKGHFLLRLEGTKRTWVVTDGAQLAINEVSGPAPLGDYDRSQPLDVIVHSRLFRSCDPEDASLFLTEETGRRRQTLQREGMSITVDAPLGTFPGWFDRRRRLSGLRAGVSARTLIEACHMVAMENYSSHCEERPIAWIAVRSGRLLLEASGHVVSTTRVEVSLSRSVGDTLPILINPDRLAMLLKAVESDEVTLTFPTSIPAPLGVQSGGYTALLMPLDRITPARENLEELLKRVLQVESISPDEEGDYSVLSPEGHQLWVRLYTHAERLSVQVFSVLATDVEPTAGLMEELNSINASAAYVKVVWKEGAVIAEADLVAEWMIHAEFETAMRSVWETVDRYRSILGAWFCPVGADESFDE